MKCSRFDFGVEHFEKSKCKQKGVEGSKVTIQDTTGNRDLCGDLYFCIMKNLVKIWRNENFILPLHSHLKKSGVSVWWIAD